MTAFTGTLPTFSAGEVLPSADLQTLAAALHGLADPWVSFSPTFTNLTVGNGVFSSVTYWQVGKTVFYQGRFQWGSTTSATTSPTLLSIPVTAIDADMQGSALIFANSPATSRQAGICLGSTTSTLQFYGSLVGGNVASTTPFTWNTGCILQWSIMYQAA